MLFDLYWRIGLFFLVCGTVQIAGLQKSPLIILIDDDGQELHFDQNAGAIGLSFDQAITEAVAPILVSKNVLLSYISRNNEGIKSKSLSLDTKELSSACEQLVSVSIDRRNWQLYKLPSVAYYLLVPVAHTSLQEGFYRERFYDVSEFLPWRYTAERRYYGLQKYLTKDRNPQRFAAINFNQVLKQLSREWVFCIVGHGSKDGLMAGVSAENMHSFLMYCNNCMPVSLVYIATCFLGGANKFLLKPSKHQAYKFPLVISSLNDSVVALFLGDIAFQEFFSKAGERIQEACLCIAPQGPSEFSSHGIFNAPQICLPNSASFEFSPLNEELAILRSDRLIDNSGFFSQQAHGLLLYEKSYQNTLLVTPVVRAKIDADPTPLEFIPTADTLLFYADAIQETSAIQNYMWLNQSLVHAARVLSQQGQTITSAVGCKKRLSLCLYPAFVSMLHENREIERHHFSRVVVNNQVEGYINPLFGIFHFIRDAFFDLNRRASENYFCIDSLEGFNDYLLIIEMMRYHGFFPYEETALECELAPFINSRITLKNFFIKTKAERDDVMKLEIGFEFNGRGWFLNFSGKAENFTEECAWRFAEMPRQDYAYFYAAHKTEALGGAWR